MAENKPVVLLGGGTGFIGDPSGRIDMRSMMTPETIQHNGWFTDGARPTPFKTVPTFITDSKALAPYLHRNQFVGEGLKDDSGLCIRSYKLDGICE